MGPVPQMAHVTDAMGTAPRWHLVSRVCLQSALQQTRGQMAAAEDEPLLRVAQLVMDVQLEADVGAEMIEEEPRSEKDVRLSTAPPASGLTDVMGEQDDKLENLGCRFVKLGGFTLWSEV